MDNLDAAITAIDEARKKAAVEAPPEPILLDLDALSDVEPAAVRFIVDRWLPACEAALFAGHGGTAKSWLALILAVCIALGRDFFGYHCERRRVMYYSCEDRLQVLHWRLVRICRNLGVSLADLAGWLYVYDATASDNVMYWGAAESPAERITARYDWLREKAAEHEIEVLFLDAVTDAFDANENVRALVKDFVRACLRLVLPREGAVVLISHVNRPTALSPNTTEGYSGSTHWHNSVRARWYLRLEKRDLDDAESWEEDPCPPEDELPRSLECQKSNYDKKPPTIRLLWDTDQGTFVGDSPSPVDGGLPAEILRNRQRRAILRLLGECETMGRHVPSSPNARINAATILGERKDYPRELRSKNGKKTLFRMLREIQEDKLISEVTEKNASRHAIGVWRLTDAGRVDAGLPPLPDLVAQGGTEALRP